MIYRVNENIESIIKKIYQLDSCFGCSLIKECEQKGVELEFNSPSHNNTPKVCSIRFKNVDAETLVMLLSLKEVYVSAGSACSSNSVHPSHVLKAIGLSDEEARSTIRVSFSDYNSVQEVEEAAAIIADCAKTLQSIG